MKKRAVDQDSKILDNKPLYSSQPTKRKLATHTHSHTPAKAEK